MQVRLRKIHEHAGLLLQPGAVLVMDDKTAQWLIDQGVGELMQYGAAAPRPAAQKKRVERKCCGW